MRKIFSSGAAIALLAAIFLYYTGTFTVTERTQALVVRFGEIQAKYETPGLYFKIPIIDDVVEIDKRLVFFENKDQSVQVVDSRRYVVDAVTMYRVDDPIRFREAVQADFELANQRIKTRVDAALRETYGVRTFQAALSDERGAMMREIRDQVRTETKDLGVEVVDVRIRRTDLPKDVLDQTYTRMQAERNAEAEQIRAVGNQQMLSLKAKADRDYTVTLAEAQRDAEIARGLGDADRNKVFARAFQQDPEFFAFYRSMQAYAKSLEGDGTTLVLRPDSEFFKYFGIGKPPAPGATPAPTAPPSASTASP
jgi:membrane protease subunit HflC